jgi:hypothetical protein
VFPVSGTVTATTKSQISFRGTTSPGSVQVTGSRSGRHSGRLLEHSDGQGVSFVPDKPFAPGERVSVRSRARTYSFKVGRRDPLPRTPDADPPSVGRGAVQRFVTRPDLLPPAVSVTRREPGRQPGLIFLGAKGGHGQDGPMIVDDTGRLVWFKAMPRGETLSDFRTQMLDGQPVLTWWQGRALRGEGRGEGVIYDNRYTPVRRVRAGNGLRADAHEFQLTPHGTALLVSYDHVRRARGTIIQAVIQEIDIKTGLVLFEWNSIGHIALDESYREHEKGEPWDYMHVNSIAEDRDGNFIVSARSTNAVYKISRASGRVIWRLGGKRSDFALGPGASFSDQHDARPQPDGSLTIFDNSARRPAPQGSRGIELVLDENAKTATLRRAFVHPDKIQTAGQGDMQALPGGSMFIGWGSRRFFSEFDAQGKLVLDGRLSAGNRSYRAYRAAWAGAPPTRPKVAATRSGDRTRVAVSWNGATAVARWRVVAGAQTGRLAPVAGAEAAATAFETTLEAATTQRYVAVQALDAAGTVLATSAAVRPGAR